MNKIHLKSSIDIVHDEKTLGELTKLHSLPDGEIKKYFPNTTKIEIPGNFKGKRFVY
jgi:hypothetical protein